MQTMKHLMGCLMMVVASENERDLLSKRSDLHFMVMGDWGGGEHSPYSTKDEVHCASGMNQYAKGTGAKFALALGDNFYKHGVTSAKDKRFKTTFEDVFDGSHLSSNSGFTFNVLAGNHDHYGDAHAQVEYSKHSQRWNFPNLWYSFIEKAPDGATVEFVMIDTVGIAGNSEGPDHFLTGSQLPGPLNLSAANSQVDWLKRTLAASTADYLVVSGHHPVYSIMEHGPTRALSPEHFPHLRKYKVSAYLAGHDHGGQHIDVGDGIQYHVIGSAHGGTSDTSHSKTIKSSQLKFHSSHGGGFAAISASKDGLFVKHVDKYGDVQYTAPAIKRRSNAQSWDEEPTMV